MASAEAEELASLAGFTVAFYNSNPELKALFSKALAENWTGDRLLQAARNTNWYQTHAASYRESEFLRTSDPAEHENRVNEMVTRVRRMSVEIGIPIGKTALEQTTNLAFLQGWSDDQIRNYLGRWKSVQTTVEAGGFLGGQIGAVQGRLQTAVRDFGINISPSTLGQLLNNIARGDSTEELAMGYLQTTAIAAFPGLAEQIRAGLTVREIAEPYVQSMAKLWETNPAEIDVQDPMIRSALTTKGQDGKFSMLTVPEFEVRLRKDPRWLATDNAQDSGMENAHQVLNAFGVTW